MVIGRFAFALTFVEAMQSGLATSDFALHIHAGRKTNFPVLNYVFKNIE